MLRLDFTRSDLNLPEIRETTRRASISGVQDKVQLKRKRGGFSVVESGGDYILKPIPQNTAARLADDIPVNEYLTMRIASRIFGINTAEHELVTLADGEYAYMTKRFDRRNGVPVRQEDFCQLAERSEETHGLNYKYDASYEELAALVRRYCPSFAVENRKIFFLIVFNYVFSNGDAHLKNFSLFESFQGDYILTPAYDLLNTRLHFPNEPTATGLEFFADGHFTSRYEELGFYSSEDLVELGECFGVPENTVRKMLARFGRAACDVEKEIVLSPLSVSAKELYLKYFRDRLRAIEM
jgi:serine/threonine-protein kinase HipA